VYSTFGPDAGIYYTLDGSEPNFAAIPYSGAFTLTNSVTIRAIAYNFAYSDWADAAPISLQIIPLFPLSAGTPGGGSIIASPLGYNGGILYVSNTVVTLTATPSNGWSFASWTGDSSDTTNVTTVVMDAPRTVQALFDTSLTLLTNGSGQVLLNPPAGPYLFGSTLRLTALPSPGYYFFGWANAASGFANPLLFTVTNNTPGITALFAALKPSQVSLTVLPEDHGAVLINPARNVYTNGETVTLTAVPASDSLFTGWSGDAAGSLNPLALALDSNKFILANFAVAPVFQTVTQSAGTLAFAWTAVTGQTYQLQYKTNLLQTKWSSLGSPNPATNDVMSASDSTGPDQQRFYRVIQLP
jgi:Divergent InlB B-repeat domain/Chitobiase/beta-hexosaminidase C-terminal domain